MLLPATHFDVHTFATFSSSFAPSSSSLHLFPLQFPKTKPKTKFLIRCSTPNTHTQTRRPSAIQRIADKLRSLGISEPPPSAAASSSAGETPLPFPHELPKRRVSHSFEPSWSTPLNPAPVPGTGIGALSYREVARQKRLRREELRRRRVPVPTLAELSLPDSEIRRLTTLGFAAKRKVRLAKAGVTERIVNVIHERWRRSEVVRIVCEEFSRIDLRRTHELLERKTGGLVVWRSGCKIILYRGTDYNYPCILSDTVLRQDNTGDGLQHVEDDHKYCEKNESHLSETNSAASAVHSSNVKTAKPALILGVGTPNKVRFQLPDEAELAEDRDCLLAGLGPRFTDWWGCDPLPIDADLLPAVVPGYRKPFRLLPYGVEPKLTADEMTTLKRLGRPLPCHFALGRNRKLQGLAAAIIKLWEKCEIVKIAVKRGVQNTSSKIMARELKLNKISTSLQYLTGGILLSRDREFFVFYRGKDYLPAAVSSAITQQRNILMYKLKAQNSPSVTVTPDQKDGTIECDSEVKGMNFHKDTKQRMLTKAEAAIKRTGIKLSMSSLYSQGRRGVFDGTVENMHLHWKYRELVKIVCIGSLEDAYQIALTLEAESGGILVAVERVRKGFAIIVYRGKNYSFPARLRPQTLLNKKQALKRSIEAQRLEVEDKEGNKKHIAEALKFDMAKDKYEACSNYVNWDSAKEASVDDQQAIWERPIELIDSGEIQQGEPKNSINWNSPREASVDDKEGIQEQAVRMIDSGGAHQGEPENFRNWISPREASVADQQAIQEQPVELIDCGGAQLGKPENSINWNSPKEASVDNLQAIREQPVELIDSDGAHQGKLENSISWNSSGEASIDNQQAIQGCPVELIDGSGAHQDEPVSWPSLIHKAQLDGVSDSVTDTEHCVSNRKVTGSSNSLSKVDPESPAPVILPSKSVHLSTKERLLLRKQALKMIKEPTVAIGKSNIVSDVVKTIKAHFERHPLAIVNVKGRAKGTSVQELVFKLEQETGALLVSREPSKVILYRGWPPEKPRPAISFNRMSKEGGTKPGVAPKHRFGFRKRRMSRTGSRSNLYFKRDSTPIFSAVESGRRNLG
ncbi:hypothetical protein Fmac_016821 [Flemingia macrophylla]|uniref:CRM domain-containing protein n=1 Tax=Flemingia macrophylla TaxID=520843 RepID=A0ABD1MIG7_9FABA